MIDRLKVWFSTLPSNDPALGPVGDIWPAVPFSTCVTSGTLLLSSSTVKRAAMIVPHGRSRKVALPARRW